MSVYKRPGSDIYSYDFRLDGLRYSGVTGTADLDKAREFERVAKAEASTLSFFCRSVIRKARRNLPAKPESRRGYVYMLRSGYFIKIGHSLNPAERLGTINTANPHSCELLFCFPGEIRVEREMHKEFEACHYQREWFFLCGKLKRFVEEYERFSASDDLQDPQRKVPREFPTEVIQPAGKELISQDNLS